MSKSTVGSSMTMIDGVQRVTGTIDYAINIEKEGMLYAKAVRSPYAHALIKNIDTEWADEIDGVVKVITFDDFKNQDEMTPVFGAVLKDQLIVADDRVKYIGDIVAVVVAETMAQAEEAALLVDVDYEELPAVFGAKEAMKEDAPVLHDIEAMLGTQQYYKIRPKFGTNCCHHFRLRKGDMEKRGQILTS